MSREEEQQQQQQTQRPSEKDPELIKYVDIFSRIQENVLHQPPQVSGDQSSEGETKETGKKEQRAVSIGDALLAAAITAGQKAVDRSDAAAIQAVEVRATGQTNIMPKGLAATAQSAAQTNARTATKEKITLAQVLRDAKAKLPKDRAVTRQDAQGVVGAELRNNPNITTYPGGVAASMVAAARINQNILQPAK